MSEIIKAIITTLDNLPMLEEQIPILQTEGLSEIIVVNNGSKDGTGEWLNGQDDVTAVHCANLGAGPGRNAGLDAAGEFDYALMLDGGIRPLRGGVRKMLDYLEANPDVDVISPEIATCFTTDKDLAHRRFAGEIDASRVFHQHCLSSTAYALCRRRAFDNIRYCEEGPFGEPGWGVDDNELACQWEDKGIIHHDFSHVIVGGESIQLLLYRRASGSFTRLYQETGIWPNQYGSVFEQRHVMLMQMYPQYFNPPWHTSTVEVSCVVVGRDEYPAFAKTIKRLHDDLADTPHEIIFVNNGSTDETKWWLDTFALRQHHGDTTIDVKTGKILLRRNKKLNLESIWTGNVIRIDLDQAVTLDEAKKLGKAKAKGEEVRFVDVVP